MIFKDHDEEIKKIYYKVLSQALGRDVMTYSGHDILKEL